MKVPLSAVLIVFVSSIGAHGVERTFSETQEWGQAELKMRAMDSPCGLDSTIFKIPKPPIGQDELALLRSEQLQREAADLAAIKANTGFANWKFADLAPLAPAFKVSHPETSKLIHLVFTEANVAAYHLQATFDRSRPSVNDSFLKPAIPNPANPAYPSEYATSAISIANTLALLDAKSTSGYAASAAQIAKLRVTAGVAYPSDLAAGRELARQLINELVKNPKFTAAFTAAQKEIARKPLR